jgi:hypothetical protein
MVDNIPIFTLEDLEKKNPVRQKKNVCIFFCKTEENESIPEIENPIDIIDKRNEKITERNQIIERLELRDVHSEIKSKMPVQQINVTLNELPPLPSPSRDKPVEKKREKEGEGDRDRDREEEEETEDPERKPKKKIGEKKKTEKKKEMETTQPETQKETQLLRTVKIGDKIVAERLPKQKRFVMKVSNFYMNNRKLYIEKLSQIFKPYRDEILNQTENITCDSLLKPKIDFGLLTHQKVVRDYLNLFTPYRGVLLYHSLGSGKSCSSIAIAEGMKSEKNIVLMTPASLKMNFFRELKKCGDPLYRLNQYWEFISIDGKPDLVAVLAKSLSLPTQHIRKQGGAWMVDVSKPSNIGQLNASDQQSLNEQIDMMIRTKYTDINYNGFTKKKLRELTQNGTINPFDHKVVVVDEAHNLVSMIVNKLQKKSSISYQLYNYLMDAIDVRIVLVSGTPIINYPNEIGVLFNILRGYIKTWTFHVQTTTEKKVNRDFLLKLFRDAGIHTVDYVEYSGNVLQITRNPFGFVNTYSNKKAGGGITRKKQVQKNNKTRKQLASSPDSQESLYSLKKDGVMVRKPIQDMEIGQDESMDHYYQHMDNMYKGGANEFAEYTGVTLDETGNIDDVEFQKQIVKTLENAGIHVLVPNQMELKKKAIKEKEELKQAISDNDNDVEAKERGKIDNKIIPPIKYKGLPDTSKEFIDMFVNVNTGDITNIDVLKRRILGLTSYYKSSQEQLMPSFVKTNTNDIYHREIIPMSNFQFAYYYKYRKEERDRDKKQKPKPMDDVTDDLKISSTYRIRSRSACNFAFPNEYPRPMPTNENVTEDELNAVTKDMQREKEDYIEEEEENEDLENPSVDYLTKLKNVLDALKYDPLHPRPQEFLTEEGLELYSPKFLRILQNIQNKENKGLHMIYSQFRTVEGIELFKLVLEAAGYVQFKIKKVGETWELDIKPEDMEKPKFMLYTGTETKNEKEIMLNIYNGTWDFIPQELANQLREKNENNMFGEVIRIIMITSSGAEGINLRNTRFVHITEPYWNITRIEQVIGRARRICSHQDLPEDMRNVKVYLYQSVFTAEQKKDDKNIELMLGDVSRIDGSSPVTTDEYLFEISQIKNRMNSQILKTIKETAIDCSIYTNTNAAENLVCYGFGKVYSNAFGTYPNLEMDKEEKTEENLKTVDFQPQIITDETTGMRYVVNKRTNEVYDFESYNMKKLNPQTDVLFVGNLVKKNGKYQIQFL